VNEVDTPTDVVIGAGSGIGRAVADWMKANSL